MRSQDFKHDRERRTELGPGSVEVFRPLGFTSTRRRFLQVVSGTSASLLLGTDEVRAGNGSSAYWFLDTETAKSWLVDDPVRWSLENARQPILGRATQGLLKLTPADGQRVVRLVVRRCNLNLLEVLPSRVLVHYWGQQGLGDLRPFFKTQRLAEPATRVVLIDRKREASTVRGGDDFLYGDRFPTDWPLEIFLEKWQRRFQVETDDWTAAPSTRAGYGWEGIEGDCIPWTAMKSAWRRGRSLPCPNCERPTLLINFGSPQTGCFCRSTRLIYACKKCRRMFLDHSVADAEQWMVRNLDADARPVYDVFWGRHRISTLV